MATQTAHFELEKPSQTDVVDVAVLNNNFDDIDTVMFANQERSKAAVSNAADAYDAAQTYTVGDLVIYENQLYKCTTAITTAEQWDSTKWAETTLADELGEHGGGTEVEANPSGTATDTLSKIGIAGTIYEILGGGGAGGSGKAVGIRDVTNLITPSSGIVLDSGFNYKAVQVGNVVFLNARGTITSGAASAGTNFDLFDIDQSIAPQMTTDNFAYGTGASNRYVMSNLDRLKVRVDTGSWCGFEIYWTVEETYVGDTEYTFSPVIYSEEEREIGVWIDGKPIYKKVIIFSEPIQVTYTSIFNTTIDSSDIENIISAIGIHADGTNYGDMLADPTISGHTIIGLQTSRNNNYANVKKLILEYTKISDSPGSGTWTPSGVPAVHYSTEEHVIGKWIDGITDVYEKIIELPSSSFPTASNHAIDTAIGETVYVLHIDGMYWFRDGIRRTFGSILIQANGTIDNGYSVQVSIVNNNTIRLTSSYDRSSAEGYVKIQYLKSTT